jgi:hypothetical protein
LNRWKRSNKLIEKCDKDLKVVWKKTEIGTAARPTYSMSLKYAHNGADNAKIIAGIMKRSLIND